MEQRQEVHRLERRHRFRPDPDKVPGGLAVFRFLPVARRGHARPVEEHSATHSDRSCLPSGHLFTTTTTITKEKKPSSFSFSHMMRAIPHPSVKAMQRRTFSATVDRLLSWKLAGDDDNSARKKVEAFCKKLKRDETMLNELERALSRPGFPSGCVTIPRSTDGRVQVSNRKGYPHVISCQLWRWPDLRNGRELRAIDSCEFAYFRDKREVCINPYHYVRVEIPVLHPVLVPRIPERPAISRLPLVGPQSLTTPSSVPPFSDNGRQAPGGGDALSIAYSDQIHWCDISYYEKSLRIGEVFKCGNQLSAIVDGSVGYPSCSDNRFSVGALTNVHRDDVIEHTRHHIGKGVLLYYNGGEVFAECLSESSIFIQSRSLNQMNGLGKDSVFKVPSGHKVKVFSNLHFEHQLHQAFEINFEAVYDLIEQCRIVISFVKGWGDEYQRKSVTSTPCWIEVVLNGPQVWIDKVLVTMGGPTATITSTSG